MHFAGLNSKQGSKRGPQEVQMKRSEALELARRIIETVGHKILIEGDDYQEKEVKIHDFYIFGSTVRKCDDETVGDLDMIIFDDGELSRYFMIDCQEEDWYKGLKGNLQFILNEIAEWNFQNHNDYGCKAGELLNYVYKKNISVDLHILPEKFFRDRQFRKEVAEKHKDPNFFKNMFSLMLHWRNGKQFVPVTHGYFVDKYRLGLSDLKK